MSELLNQLWTPELQAAFTVVVVLLVILLAFLPDMLGKKKTASGAETQEPIREADETKSSTGVDIPSDTEEKT